MKDEHRLLLAFALSFVVLFAFQYYYTRFYRSSYPAQPAQENPQALPQKTVNPPPEESVWKRELGAPLPSTFFHTSFFFTFTQPNYRAEIVGNKLSSWVLSRYRSELSPHSPPVEICTSSAPCVEWGFMGGNKETLFPVTIVVNPTPQPTISYQYRFPGGTGEIQIRPFSPYSLLLTFTASEEVEVRPYLKLFPLTGEPDLPQNLALKFHRYGELRTIKGKDLEKNLLLEASLDWILWDGKYFAVGWLFPLHSRPNNLTITASPPLTGATLLPLLLPGANTFTVEFVGIPKEFRLLRTLSGDLDRILDFGWSGFLARPLAALLHFFYGLFRNYGIAIIVLTFLVRLLLYPLTFKSFHSMQQLARLRPRIEEIQKKFKNDPRRLQEELIKLYRSEKVNPFSGCLPLILQLPVFIALYNVLLISVELRHAGFILWIRDLSAPDTLYTLTFLGLPLPVRPLPIAMGITTYLQQKLSPSPQTLDPAQKIIFSIMPLFLTIVSYGFPSGLVLYWFVSNLFSIGQQWWMMRKLVPNHSFTSQ